MKPHEKKLGFIRMRAEGRRKAAQLIQTASLQEGALAKELKELAKEALTPPPEG